MNSEEILKQKLLSGELSLRELAQTLHKDSRDIKKMIMDSLSTDEERKKFERVLQDNRGRSSIGISKKIKETLIKILKGEMSEREASDLYQIDRETLRRKLEELANSSPKYIRYYIKYKSKRGDYSGINFRRIFVELIEENMTQKNIAKKYGIPIRTISRELEKLGKSKDESDIALYSMAKTLADKHIKRRKITEEEAQEYKETLNNIKRNNKFIEFKDEDSTEKNIRELKEFVNKVNGLKRKGLTNVQIASELGIGISTIRRRILKLRELEGIEEKKKIIEEQNERE